VDRGGLPAGKQFSRKSAVTDYSTGAGQTTNGLDLNGSDTQTVLQGGVANSTTLHGQSQLTVNGGTVHDAQLLGTPGSLSEPFFRVTDGIASGTVIHHGSMGIDGGTVLDTVIASTGPSDHASVYITGGTVTNISADFGNLYTSGGTVTGVTLSGTASQGVSYHAQVTNTTVNAGAQQVISFGSSELHTDAQGRYDNVTNTVVNSGGKLILNSAGISGVTLHDGAMIDFQISDPSNGGRVHDFGAGTVIVSASDVLTIADSSQSFSVQLAGDYSNTNFALTPDGQGGTTVRALCFCRGTAIRTTQGDQPVETLRCGDSVVVRDGAARPIRWIGRSAAIVDDETRPLVIAAGAFPDGTPYRELRVTRGHSFVFGQVLIPIGALVNGTTIRWDLDARYAEVFHVELDVHDILFAEGAPAESYRDDGNGRLFRVARSAAPGTMPTCLPVVTAGPIVDRTRKRLIEHGRGLVDQSPIVLGSEFVRSSIS
jgi:hypothetical protein